MHVVAVAGAKGGVGKTAAAVNLAALAALGGHRTLLWDLDPQGAATHCYRIRPKVKGGASRLLGGKRDLQSFTRGTDYPNLDLLPADGSFRVVDTVLGTRRWPERVIRKLVRPLDRSYDVLVLDCAPGLGVVTEAVVAASDLVLAPIVPAPLAVRSLDQLGEFVDAERPGLTLLAFLSMVDERKVLHRQMLELVRADRRFALSAVPSSSAVERMGLEQVPAVVASPRNLAAAAYRQLWAEVAERLDLEPGDPVDLEGVREGLGLDGPSPLTSDPLVTESFGSPAGVAAATDPAKVTTDDAGAVASADTDSDTAAAADDGIRADSAGPADPFTGWFTQPG